MDWEFQNPVNLRMKSLLSIVILRMKSLLSNVILRMTSLISNVGYSFDIITINQRKCQ